MHRANSSACEDPVEALSLGLDDDPQAAIKSAQVMSAIRVGISPDRTSCPITIA
jgi:hypothetical protein